MEGRVVNDLYSRLRKQEDFVWEAFSNPDALLQPAYTWVWNAPLKRAEIVRQLDAMAEAGIGCIYILPEPKQFREYNERIFLLPEYLTEEFFHAVRDAAECAWERGICVWLYDEGGWPSGSACGRVLAEHPELCRKVLARRKICLKEGAVYAPGEGALAAFVQEGGVERMVTPGEKAAQSEAELTEYYVQWQGGNAVDALDEALGRTFVDCTHERYTEFLADFLGNGNEQKGGVPNNKRFQMMFTDEPGTGRCSWPRGFARRFRQRFGYDILPYLPALLDGEADVDEAGTRARMDYRQLAGEMFREHYFVPIHDWCRRNHVLSTGHLDIDHLSDGCMYHNYGSVLSLLREMDVPGVDVIWRQIDFPRDGRPSCAEGNGFFPRFAASAAAQSGGKYAVSESFAVYGASLTGECMRYVIHYQLVRGVNIFNFMSMSYGGDSAVPLVMRPDFRAEMPGYGHLRAINDYTARLCHLMQLGRPGADTALYLPQRDIWANGSVRARAVAAFDEMGKELEAQQVDFDILDDEAVRRAEKDGDALCIGLARYRHVVVPKCAYMPEDVRCILNGIDSSIVPAMACDQPAVRVRSRILPDGGRIWMLFLEAEKQAVARVSIPGEGPLYRIDAEPPRLERVSELEQITLYPGEARFYLRATVEIREAEQPFAGRERVGSIGEFSLRKTRETVVSQAGLREKAHAEAAEPCALGGWQRVFGSDFSGEGVYSAEVCLDAPAKDTDAYVLALGKVECSARVRIDGREAGIAWAPPYQVHVDGALLSGKKRFLLEIEVANTMANQIAAHPLKDLFAPEDLGPYQEKLHAFEKNAPMGGLYGPVALYRLSR